MAKEIKTFTHSVMFTIREDKGIIQLSLYQKETHTFISAIWYPFQTQVVTNLVTKLSKYVPQIHWQEIWTY